MLPILFLLSLLLSTSSASNVDFCVGETSGLVGPAGYACIPPANVTSDDFAFSGLGEAGDTSNSNNVSITPAFVAEFPGVNGLDLSGARLDFAPGGVVPLHIHPSGNELLFVLQGNITAAFISSANTVYVKTLKKGDIMVFPQGLLHLQKNVGVGNAVALAAFSSPNPGVQLFNSSLSASNFYSDLLENVSFLDDAEVQKLKAVFVGSG